MSLNSFLLTLKDNPEKEKKLEKVRKIKILKQDLQSGKISKEEYNRKIQEIMSD